MDSGGHHTDAVYDYVKPRQTARRRVFAIKGMEYLTKPGLAAEGTTKRSAIKLFMLGTVAAKDRIFARMAKVHVPGPGFMHLPRWIVGTEYPEQMTAERLELQKNRRTGRVKKIYVKVGTRNEALDLEVYCLCGLWILQNIVARGVFDDFEKVLVRLQEQGAKGKNEPPKGPDGGGGTTPPSRGGGGGWVNSW